MDCVLLKFIFEVLALIVIIFGDRSCRGLRVSKVINMELYFPRIGGGGFGKNMRRNASCICTLTGENHVELYHEVICEPEIWSSSELIIVTPCKKMDIIA